MNRKEIAELILLKIKNETISKLGYDLKNAISHRSVAVEKMLNTIFRNE